MAAGTTAAVDETKIIYHVDDEDTPYLVKLPVPPDRVTLADFKGVLLNRPSCNYKFFFKSMDDDFGVVKEEIVDEDGKLPLFNGRVVSWLVSAEGSTVSDGTMSQCPESVSHMDMKLLPQERSTGIGDNRQSSFHTNAAHDSRSNFDDSTCTETESMISSRRDRLHRSSGRAMSCKLYHDNHRLNGHNNGKHDGRGLMSSKGGHGVYDESSSMMSSDIESTSFFDSEDETTSRISSTTERSSVSRIHAAATAVAGRHRRRRRKHRMPPMSRTSSFSSITDSTMSLNIITVTLNMDTVNFLGISIVGQSNKGGDGGIYVGSIMKGGAVALDGRIEPGDMILQVNDINFENMSNDDAVRVLRDVVQKPGPIKLVVAKCWDPNPKGYFTIPRTEPVRPIDPGAWVAHTAAIRGEYPPRPPSVSTLTSTSSSINSSVPESDRHFEEARQRLNITTDMATIVKVMASSDSGLEIRDRMWLKIVIHNAFIGADVVDWLYGRVDGFPDKREARKYAAQMLKAGYIRHTVNKITFSEQCYYIFGDLLAGSKLDNAADICYQDMSNMKLQDDDTVSEADRDTLAPLPPPPSSGVTGGGGGGVGGGAGGGGVWGAMGQMPYSGCFTPQSTGYMTMPFNYTNETMSFASFPRDGSINSGSGGSSNGSERCAKNKYGQKLSQSPKGSGSDSEVQSQRSVRRAGEVVVAGGVVCPGGGSSGSERSLLSQGSRGGGGGGSGIGVSDGGGVVGMGRLSAMQSDLSGSRQSFRMAMGNPLEEDILTYQFTDKAVV